MNRKGLIIMILHKELNTAQDNLRKLESEKNQLPSLLQSAIQNGDIERIAELKQKESSIPHLIFAARINLLQKEIAIVDEEITEASAKIPLLQSEYTNFEIEAIPKAQVLREELKKLDLELVNKKARIQQQENLMFSKNRIKDELSNKLRELSKS